MEVLAEATILGEAVLGTSGGSVYITCLRTVHFNMAVRSKLNNTISLRIEATVLGGLDDNSSTKLATLGFVTAGPGLHFSQHFKCEGGPLSGCAAYEAVVGQIRFLFDNFLEALPWKDVQQAGK